MWVRGGWGFGVLIAQFPLVYTCIYCLIYSHFYVLYKEYHIAITFRLSFSKQFNHTRYVNEFKEIHALVIVDDDFKGTS